MIVTHVTKHDRDITPVTVTVTQSYNTKKDIEDSKINNIIQYSNNMLVL